MIYFDNSATTKPCQEAVEAMMTALREDWANPSALYEFGIHAARQLRSARHQVAAAMGAEPDRIFFTSGGTEADNWAIAGSIKRLGKRFRGVWLGKILPLGVGAVIGTLANRKLAAKAIGNAQTSLGPVPANWS